MATLDWELTRTDGITLVELYVRSEADEYVRIESNLQPVWPPRRQGRPRSGWDETGFEGSVSADSVRALGYASPAEPVDPPATIVPADSPKRDTATPETLVRTLGDASPPPDAIAYREQMRSTPAETDRRHGETTSASTNSHQEHVTAWCAEIENRVADAQQLAGVSDVDDARKRVAAAGGLDAVGHLKKQLENDRKQLEALQQRTATLQARLDAVEIPLSTLERVT